MTWVDLIRDGVDVTGRSGLRGDAAVDSALIRSAMGAIRAEVGLERWSAMVHERCCSKLGAQAARNARGKPVDLHKRIARAWDRAVKRTANGKITAGDVPDKIGSVRQWIEAGCPRGRNFVAMNEHERRILHVACDEGERLNTTRPALPWRRVAKLAEFGPSPTRRTLKRLDQREILRKIETGRSGDPHKFAPMAATYQLPVALASVWVRITAPVDGKPTPVDADLEPVGRLATPVDADLGNERMKEAMDMIKMSPEALIALLDWARDRGVTTSAQPEPVDLPANVTPIRRPS